MVVHPYLKLDLEQECSWRLRSLPPAGVSPIWVDLELDLYLRTLYSAIKIHLHPVMVNTGARTPTPPPQTIKMKAKVRM